MFPVDLIPELRDHIVSYLGPWDEIASFTLTCHQAVEAVEAFSRRELDRIEREHNVDDTWRFRVGMQVAQDAAERLSSEGGQRQEGVMLVPNNVSHRRMLRSAYRTHLYSLETTRSHADWTSLISLSMHPNGKHLLSGGQGRPGGPKLLRLWDLSTKECIKSFVGHHTSTDPSAFAGDLNVGFSAGHMVSSNAQTLRIWSMNGVCKHVLTPIEESVDHDVSAFSSSNETVYLVDKEGPIYVINTVMGSSRAMTEQPWENDFSAHVELHVCKNYLLILRSDAQDDNHNNPPYHYAGVYIIDRGSEQVHSHFVGQYGLMACTDDGDVTLASHNGGIDVFQLVDGHLVPRLSILSHPAPPPHDFGVCSKILHMTKTHIFVKDESLGRRSRIVVYNAVTGTVERSLYYPTVEHVTDMTYYCPTFMVSNEREVFVGIGLQHGTHASRTIKAFLLR